MAIFIIVFLLIIIYLLIERRITRKLLAGIRAKRRKIRELLTEEGIEWRDCKKCGILLLDNAAVCPQCGIKQ